VPFEPPLPPDRPTGKVVIVTTVHRTFDVRIFHKQARSLREAGHEVVLVARAPADEMRGGVRVISLPEPRGRLNRATTLAARALRLALAERADVYHLHDPELIWVGLALKILGRRVVYDVHEELALMPDRAYLPRWLIGIATAGLFVAERLAAAAFDAIVAATPLIAEHFPAAKTVLVRNTPRASELADASTTPFAQRPPRVAYVGGLAAYHNVDGMIGAMARLPPGLGARLSLGGSFLDAAAEARARALPGAEHVDFEGWVERPRLVSILGQARAGLAVYLPTPNVLRSDPIKFLEMMGAGLPIVASDIPRWRELVQDRGCALLVDPADPGQIAAAINRLVADPALAQDMGRRGRQAVLAHYEWRLDEARLLRLYDRLVRASVRRAPPSSHDCR
jgi:glycosyltransferase involved in cell wall biosynthesis